MRLVSTRFTSNTTWVAPAGVTQITCVPDGGVGVAIDVVPNTSYSIIAATSPGSFGSLFSYKFAPATGYFTIFWIEG